MSKHPETGEPIDWYLLRWGDLERTPDPDLTDLADCDECGLNLLAADPVGFDVVANKKIHVCPECPPDAGFENLTMLGHIHGDCGGPRYLRCDDCGYRWVEIDILDRLAEI